MSAAGRRILAGLRDALAFARGEPNGCVVHTPEDIQRRRAEQDEVGTDHVVSGTSQVTQIAKSCDEAVARGEYLWESAVEVLHIGTPSSQVTTSWAVPVYSQRRL